MFVPALFSSLRGYTRKQALADVSAGVIVGIVALPLAIAFAIASGLSPEYGLYTAIVAGFLISALGGSKVQIGGPTGAFVIIVYGIVQAHGVDGLRVATLMAGIMLVLFGVVRLGAAIKFIPFPVTTGFTSGIAVIIALQQYVPFFGLKPASEPADFIGKIKLYATMSNAIDLNAVAVGVLTLAILLYWPKVSRRVPAPFVALLVGTLVVKLFGLDVATVGSRFGAVRFGLPTLQVPAIDPASIRPLLAPAFSIALLAAVESLLSAVVADGMIGTRHKSNAELVARRSPTSLHRSSAECRPRVPSRARPRTSAWAAAHPSPESCTRSPCSLSVSSSAAGSCWCRCPCSPASCSSSRTT